MEAAAAPPRGTIAAHTRQPEQNSGAMAEPQACRRKSDKPSSARTDFHRDSTGTIQSGATKLSSARRLSAPVLCITFAQLRLRACRSLARQGSKRDEAFFAGVLLTCDNTQNLLWHGTRQQARSGARPRVAQRAAVGRDGTLAATPADTDAQLRACPCSGRAAGAPG
jgi:hypothetical protein